MAKIKSSMRTGSGSSMVYIPKLAWFSFADSFLKKTSDIDSKSDTNLVRIEYVLYYYYDIILYTYTVHIFNT